VLRSYAAESANFSWRVLAIARVENQFHWAEQPVEYALKMHNFRKGIVGTMFELGKLNETTYAELGTVVAQYHAKAQTNDYIRTFGEVAVQGSYSYQQTKKYIVGLKVRLNLRKRSTFG